jgi:glutathione synthase/RimK-type ligase-like ATP-grasp enzyme
VVDEVVTHGEVSVVVIGGAPRAAFLKRPAPDDWRVQSDFGGSVESTDLTDELCTVALTAVAGTPATYARVDVVRCGDHWAVMELELIEPELYFRLDPSLADRLVDELFPD